MYSNGRLGDQPFLGSRNATQTGAPYVWKSWVQVHTLVDQLAAGILSLNLMPEVEEEGAKWRFMGLYAKNREEWTLAYLATLR